MLLQGENVAARRKYCCKEIILAGEKSLIKLLSSMSPKLIDGEYVFCTVKNANYGDYTEAKPLASFAEEEGFTLVLLKESAEKLGLQYENIFRCITLTVHSSLEAVGLTAAVSTKLSEHQISANIIAAYYHDHVFVPSRFAEKAMSVLSELSR